MKPASAAHDGNTYDIRLASRRCPDYSSAIHSNELRRNVQRSNRSSNNSFQPPSAITRQHEMTRSLSIPDIGKASEFDRDNAAKPNSTVDLLYAQQMRTCSLSLPLAKMAAQLRRSVRYGSTNCPLGRPEVEDDGDEWSVWQRAGNRLADGSNRVMLRPASTAAM